MPGNRSEMSAFFIHAITLTQTAELAKTGALSGIILRLARIRAGGRYAHPAFAYLKQATQTISDRQKNED